MLRFRARASSAVLAALLAVVVPGCASLDRVEAPDNIAQAKPEWLEAQKPRIRERAEARWKALIDGDVKSAYEFETPEYRGVFSIQQYRGKIGKAVDWQVARVKSVEYDLGNVARVVVEVEYEALISAATNARGVRQMQEKWLYSDGNWWYLSQ